MGSKPEEQDKVLSIGNRDRVNHKAQFGGCDACPKCKGDIHLNEKGDGLLCSTCKLMYPIKDDIPVMLVEEAISIT